MNKLVLRRQGLLQRLVCRRRLNKLSTTNTVVAWEALDAAETTERVRLSAIMQAIRRKFPIDKYRSSYEEKEERIIEPRSAEAEKYPPDETSCAILLRWLRSGGTLSQDFCLKVLHGATEILRQEARVRYSKHHAVVVIGDLHGSAWDLCAAMAAAGTPSKDNMIVFNGDYVDRGPRSIEVLITVLALKLCFGHWIHINRGNHEDEQMSRVYDFEAELQSRFNTNGASQILEAAGKCFTQMPIALVLKDSLILHGNIPRDAKSLSDLEKTPRIASVATLHFETFKNSKQLQQARLLQDILWSDPNADQGTPFAPNARRGGAGAAVSDDMLATFLHNHHLVRLIRSHEVTALGAERYQLSATTERWTVFSQARYPYGEGLNKAAVIAIIQNEQGDILIEPRRWSGVAPLTRYRGLGPRVRGLLRRHRDCLRAYAAGDVYKEKTAYDACAVAIGADRHAWRLHLLPAAFMNDLPKSAIDIADAADKLHFELHAFHADASVQAKHGNLSLTHRPSARHAFEALDLDKDGFISFEEFLAFVTAELPTLQPHQAAASWLFLDADDSGKLDLDEFQRGFAVLRDDRDPNNWDDHSFQFSQQQKEKEDQQSKRRSSSGFDYS
uniref:Serine/threonine-protein phosphatase n=1 Tax=Aureoumbra lagunensis TaxID=44058 RepID=A0A7S3JMU6_9STRA